MGMSSNDDSLFPHYRTLSAVAAPVLGFNISDRPTNRKSTQLVLQFFREIAKSADNLVACFGLATKMRWAFRQWEQRKPLG